MHKNGFDLTTFNSAQSFEEVLKFLECLSEGKLDVKKGYWVWNGRKGTIITANNPVTGEYGRKNLREPEVGYASYMRLETESEAFGKKLSAFICDTADVKEFTPGVASFI